MPGAVEGAVEIVSVVGHFDGIGVHLIGIKVIVTPGGRLGAEKYTMLFGSPQLDVQKTVSIGFVETVPPAATDPELGPGLKAIKKLNIGSGAAGATVIILVIEAV